MKINEGVELSIEVEYKSNIIKYGSYHKVIRVIDIFLLCSWRKDWMDWETVIL